MKIETKFEVGDLVRHGCLQYYIARIENVVHETGPQINYECVSGGEYYNFKESELVKLEDAK